MTASKIKYLLVIATLMFLAKPFVGFSLRYQHYFKSIHHRAPSILVKSFTKRKLEYTDDSELNPAGIHQNLTNPVLPVVMLLMFALNVFLPRLFSAVKSTTHSALDAIFYGLAPPQQLYLLSGKLTI